MTILVTTNTRTGARRYFVNSRRVTRDQADAAKLWRRLDSFHTTTRGGVVRQYCEARD